MRLQRGLLAALTLAESTAGAGGTPIGNPFYLGQSSGAATANVKEITTGAAVAAGSAILATLVGRDTFGAVTCTDQVGNTYSVVQKDPGPQGHLFLAIAQNVTALPSSNWIRFSTDSTDYCQVVADAIPSANPTSPIDRDVGPQSFGTVSGAFSLGTGDFASAADQIGVETAFCYDGTNFVYTPSTGFTGLTSAIGGADEYEIYRSWKRIQATPGLTLNASWTSTPGTQRASLSFRSFKGA